MILLTLAAAVIPTGQTFTCTPTAVYDGDGPIWCAEGPRIRIAGIAAREMDGTCKSNHPCPDATAEAAKVALANILGGRRDTLRTGHYVVRAKPMACRSTGSAGGDRTGAYCTLADGRDLSCEMIKSGTVRLWQRYWRGRRC